MKKLIPALLAFAVCGAAHAGVAEKKAYDKITKGLEAKTPEVKKWCQNAAMKMSVKRDAKYKASQIGIAETNILTDFFAGLKQVCSDKDYRAEVKKLTAITFSLTDKPIKGTPKGIFKLANRKKTLRVVVHVSSSLSNGISTSVATAIKKLY
jgi:hypothetical protein